MKRTASDLDLSLWETSPQDGNGNANGGNYFDTLADLVMLDQSGEQLALNFEPEAPSVGGLTRVNTIGGGQCAFGGFACGIVDHVLLDRFDERANSGHFQPFLNIFNEITQCEANWQAFKNYLHQHLNPPMELQRSVAMSLRRLLVTLRRQQLNDVSEAELEVFRCAFAVYVREQLHLPNRETGYRGDDIYSRHHFMMEKFAELLAPFHEFDIALLTVALNTSPKDLDESQRELLEIYNQVLSAAQESLVDWYMKQGYGLFTEAMADDSAYAGDLELKLLAQFWQVTFKAERTQGGHQFVHTIHADFGRINSINFTEQQRRMLKNFGIVDRNEDNEGYLLFIENSREKVMSRLENIPHADMLFVYWDSWAENRAKPQELRTPVQLSEDFTAEIINQLFARDLLVRNNGQINFPVGLSDEEFRLRLQPFTDEERRTIMRFWDDNYRPAPEIRCANDNALHWEYCQPDNYPWVDLRPAALPKPVSMSSLLNCDAVVETADISWTPLQNNAFDLINALRTHTENFNDLEAEFYAKILKKLEEIKQHNVITKTDALLLIDPKIRESESRNNVCIFRDIYYFNILAAAYEELIDHLAGAQKSLKFIVEKLNQNSQQDVAVKLAGYDKLLQEIDNNLGEPHPLPQHVTLFEDADLSGLIALNQLHNWSFCDLDYQQHLSNLRTFVSHLNSVMSAAKMNNIADAIMREMLDYEFDQESLLFSFVERIQGHPDSLSPEDLILMDTLIQAIDEMGAYPTLQETLKIFIARIDEILSAKQASTFSCKL